tara:strand:- start:496 stop:2370 length:1875 start_codon:yes stop_codon:yes gene_type:complete
MSQLVVGTAGHIDHGKTSLIKALTGTNTDRLREEKERGMTIDLGFAFLDQAITIIDVPGHEKFIRNMVAGASNIHYGLIVVAADDGVMPQTIEHLDILTLLGVNKGWVVITKIDIVNDDDWIDLVELDIQEYLLERGFNPLSINRINNLTGDGIEHLKSNMRKSISQIKEEDPSEYFRMNVDRVFSKTGFGTIVTGTVLNGMASVGDEIEILPTQIKTKIRGLQSHGGSIERVEHGDRAAINLSNIKTNLLNRGCVVSTPNIMKPTKHIVVSISMVKSTNWIIKNNQRLRFHFGTSEVLGRAMSTEKNKLERGKNANFILVLESQITLTMDDRFVIRSYSPMQTIAGGVVLYQDVKGKWSKMRDFAKLMPLDSKERFDYLVKYFRDRPRSINDWKLLFFNSVNRIERWHKDLELEQSDDGTIYSKDSIVKGRDQLMQFFNDSYKKNTFRAVLALDTIKNALSWSDQWIDIVISNLLNEGIVEQSSGGYSLANYKVQFSSNDISDMRNIEKIIKKAGFQPILISEIITASGFKPKRVGDLMHILIDNNKIQSLDNDLYLNKDYFDSLTKKVREYFSKNKEMTVADFKDLTGFTRKTAIPFLEYLDKNRFTNRKENIRLIGKAFNE